MSKLAPTHLYLIKFRKNGYLKEYQIPASTEWNAIARLGQIFGDDRDYRTDLILDIVDVKKAY